MPEDGGFSLLDASPIRLTMTLGQMGLEFGFHITMN
jgi:hypothetical protein